MKKLLYVTPVILIVAFFTYKYLGKRVEPISYSGIERDILVLASDSLQGRAPFSVGEMRSIAYLEKRMKEIGLKPAFGDSYLQPVPLVEICTQLPQELTIKNQKYIAGTDYTAFSTVLADRVSVENSPIVFVGFGIDAPEYNWNDFNNQDFTGKTIVVLVNDPGYYTDDSTLFRGNAMTYYGRWRYKLEEAERKGAAACLIVHDEGGAGYPWSVSSVRTNKPDYYLNNESLANQQCKLKGWISADAARRLFASCGKNFDMLKYAAMFRTFKPVALGASLSIEVQNTWKEDVSYNVAGYFEGTVRPHEAVIYSAHWDHLGVGAAVNGDSIYNGASDNAAAMAWMLSIAQAYKVAEPTERSVMFFAPTAEEAGMLGSEYFVANPPFAHRNMAAVFNSDVILFLGKFADVTITGYGHSQLDSLVEVEAKKQGRYICSDPNPANGMFFRSDQLPFLKAGVPAMFAKGYSHAVSLGKDSTQLAIDAYWRNIYHKTADNYVPARDNLQGLVDDAVLFFNVGYGIANDTRFPEWNRSSEFYVERN